MTTLRCGRWSDRGVCLSGICRCPMCGGEKWCYAAREPEDSEPPCTQCKKAQADGFVIRLEKADG